MKHKNSKRFLDIFPKDRLLYISIYRKHEEFPTIVPKNRSKYLIELKKKYRNNKIKPLFIQLIFPKSLISILKE